MLCGCSAFRRPARKVKQKARGTEPQDTGPIEGDAAQESNSSDTGVVANTTRDAQEIHEETNGTRFNGGDQCSEEVKLLPEHRIFLSYSSAQKPFVEQLCRELVKAGHLPFFDRRPDSLPKGKQFPALIKDAARQCHVAVVVLSKEYLLSKWPMIELIEFVRTIRNGSTTLKILPLFYKIGVENLKHEHDRVLSEWKKRCKKDKRLDFDHAADALRYLASVNGEVFGGDSELDYRTAIVASICLLYRPDVQFDVSGMQGRDRLCEVVVAEFDKLSTDNTSSWNLPGRVVGMHGIGGAGKTLLCKALCNVYSAEFSGRVLYIELKGFKDCKQEHIIKAQKWILESLTDARPELLRRIRSVEQGSFRIREALPRRDVFLALDNVPEGSTEWLQIVLSCFSPRSKAIVTSRSLENLKNVWDENPIQFSVTDSGSNIASIPHENVSFIHVPTLVEDEALSFFLQYALAPDRLHSPFTVEERRVLKSCIQRCYFVNKDERGRRPGHYHPLCLRALGSYLNGIDAHDPLEWLHKSKILEERRRFYNDSVFDILRTGYDALRDESEKLLFLDIAVFAPRRKLNNVHDLCDWLVSIHGMDKEQTLYKMKNLRRNSLIEDWEKSKTLKVTVHDLYVDFAKRQIHLEESLRRCVYERNGRALPSCLKSGPAYLLWADLTRLRLQTQSTISFPPEKLREWSNLVVLDINRFGGKSLDLSPLKCLRSLKLSGFLLETLTGFENMTELRYVHLSCNHSLVQAPDFTACSNLQELNVQFVNRAALSLVDTLPSTLKVLRITSENRKEFPVVLALGRMPSLEVVEIVNEFRFWSDLSGSMVFGNLSSLTHLRRLVLKNLPITGSLAGLGSLARLEVLVLTGCLALNALPGLDKLTNLRCLHLSCTAIESLPGLENLLPLRNLYLVQCNRLFFVVGCPGLSTCPPGSPDSRSLISSSHRPVLMWRLGSLHYIWDLWMVWRPSCFPNYFFERRPCGCPAVAALEQGLRQLQGLEEVSQYFEDWLYGDRKHGTMSIPKLNYLCKGCENCPKYDDFRTNKLRAEVTRRLY